MVISRDTDIWRLVLSMETLHRAWDRVRTNGGAAGGDGMRIEQFAIGSAGRLSGLSRALSDGRWRPLPYRFVDIPKKKGGTRRLSIPSVAERVVHSALGMVLSKILDPMFEEHSYAYRPGRSVNQALRAIERYRDEGFRHVIEADIVGYFDAVRHDRLLPKLSAALAGRPGAEAVEDLVALILEGQAQASGRMGRGVAQGSALSPVLANLYLDDLDERIHGKGVRIIRFADDFVILCRKRDTAEEALSETRATLAAEGLELHPDGTRILGFERGFEFLGALFVRSLVLAPRGEGEGDALADMRRLGEEDARQLQKAESEARIGYDRGARVLHMQEPGRRLGLRNLSFSVIGADGGELGAITPRRLDRIELGPETATDSAVMHHALAHGIELCLLSSTGETLGRMGAPDLERGALHLAQARAALDDSAAVALSRALVNARLRNQRTQLFRFNRTRKDDEITAALARMGRHLRKLPAQRSVAALRGLEGAVSAEYWPALGRACRDQPRPLRRQRPARDGLNAALNYLSAMLERDMHAATLAAGLHPGFGLLHVSRDRAEPCVWDLMEPFRAPLVEGLAVHLFNARRLRPEMFAQADDGAVRIARAGRKALITGYEQALARQVNIPGGERKLAWRPMMLWQARSLARAVREGAPSLFRPYLMEA